MWEERYATDDYLFGTEPAAFLSAQHGHLIRDGKTLVVADGEGRNSVFLASRGHSVVAFDYAQNALRKAHKLAAQKAVAIDFRQADIFAWDWTPDTYDNVVAIFIQFAPPEQRGEIFAGLAQTLKPGGVLLLHGYTPKQVEYGTGGPPYPENMYTVEILRDAFSGFDIVRLEEYEAEIAEGAGHHGRSALIDFVGRKG